MESPLTPIEQRQLELGQQQISEAINKIPGKKTVLVEEQLLYAVKRLVGSDVSVDCLDEPVDSSQRVVITKSTLKPFFFPLFPDVFVLLAPFGSVADCAAALISLQQNHGCFPRILAKGDSACSLLKRIKCDSPYSVFDCAIIVSRDVDMVSPMLTQLTYAGLLDELNLSSPECDDLYLQLRDANFAVVGPLLSKVARSLNEDYNSRHSAKTVSQLRDFVGKLQSLQSQHSSLRLHMLASSDPSGLVDSVVSLIPRLELTETLRFVVLLSALSNGLRQRDFDTLVREILHSFGYHHLVTIRNLQTAGLIRIKTQTAKLSWPNTRRSFNLVVEGINEYNPTDMAYVYSGYAPLSVRLVEYMLNKNDELVKLAPGKFAEFHQRVPQTHQRVTLVFFLGGITQAEIAALRFITGGDPARKLLIATTGIISGNSLVKECIYNF